MKRIFIYCFMMVLFYPLVGFAEKSSEPLGINTSPKTEAEFDKEELAIFEVLMKAFWDNEVKQIIINEKTAIFLKGTVTDLDTMEPFIKKEFGTALGEETFQDFKIRNSLSQNIPPNFFPSPQYHILSESELTAFKNGDHMLWDRFYQKFPNTSGILSISKIGFNSNRTQAFVYMGCSQNVDLGSGDYYLLEKSSDSKWVKKKSMRAWAI